MSKRGNIVLVPFPFTDLLGQKVRPALIVSSQPKSADVVILFITSQNKSKLPFLISILPSDSNGLKTKSAIVCNKIATLNAKVILGELGEIESEILDQIDIELKKVLGL